MRCISFASITIAPTVQNSQNHTYKISSEKAGKLHSLFNSLIWMCYLTHRHMLVFTVFRRHLLWFLLKFWAQGKKKKKKANIRKKMSRGFIFSDKYSQTQQYVWVNILIPMCLRSINTSNYKGNILF